VGAPIQTVYERVTFDKDRVTIDGSPIKADLLAPGHPLLDALIDTVLDRYGDSLATGTTFIDPTDPTDRVRVLIYLEHGITDSRLEAGGRKVVSRRFQFVEVSPDGTITDPGAEPYLNYEPLSDAIRPLVATHDFGWAAQGVDTTARSWAVTQLATPHFAEIADIIRARIARTRAAVEQRLDHEIRYWDTKAAELKQQELQGKKARISSGRARQRADELEARRVKRLRELDIEADLMNHAPTVVAAALVIPQGLIDQLTGQQPVIPDQNVIEETDRLAIAAVIAAERFLGRLPQEQNHNNPGFDVLSEDPVTGTTYFIEVKGHRPATAEIKVRAAQVRKAKMNPDRFRLAVVPVTDSPGATAGPVRYLIRPFDSYDLHFAQTYVPLDVHALAEHSVEPQ
jgi:hypothetical protein